MQLILSAIVPVYLIILLGMAAERLHLLPSETGNHLSTFTVNIAMPCLLFHLMSHISLEQFSQGTWWLCTAGIPFAIMWLVFACELLRRQRTGDALLTGLSASFNNAAFIGLPVVMNMLPGNEEAVIVAGLVIIATNTVVIPGQVCLEIWAKRNEAASSGQAATRMPPVLRFWRGLKRYVFSNLILMSTLGGLSCSLLGITVWEPLDHSLKLTGYVSPALMLFALGFGLRHKIARAHSSARGHGLGLFAHQCAIHATKLVALPLLTWSGLTLCGYTGPWLAVAVVMSAAGTAVVTAVFADIYKAAPEEAAITVVLSSFLCMFSLAAFIWLMDVCGHLG